MVRRTVSENGWKVIRSFDESFDRSRLRWPPIEHGWQCPAYIPCPARPDPGRETDPRPASSNVKVAESGEISLDAVTSGRDQDTFKGRNWDREAHVRGRKLCQASSHQRTRPWNETTASGGWTTHGPRASHFRCQTATGPSIISRPLLKKCR